MSNALSMLSTWFRPQPYVCQSCQTQIRHIRTRASRRLSRRRDRTLENYAAPVQERQIYRVPQRRDGVAAGLVTGDASRSQETGSSVTTRPKSAAEDPNYTPAQSSKGLEFIGSEEWVERQMDDKPGFQGFGVATQRTNPAAIESIFKKLAVEIDPSQTAWQKVQVTDIKTKFQVATRILSKTGTKISDHALSKARTLGQVQAAILQMQKPRTTVQALAQHLSLGKLANVEVHSRKITSIDKEKRIGRWSMIEEELRKRGLPVTGVENQIRRTIPFYDVR